MNKLNKIDKRYSDKEQRSFSENNESQIPLNNQTKSTKSIKNSSKDIRATDFRCLESKKSWIEKNDVFNLFDIFDIIEFEKRELIILQMLADKADEKFNSEIDFHFKLLEEMYLLAFGPLPSLNVDFLDPNFEKSQGFIASDRHNKILTNQNWAKIGFQGDTPSTDFRDGGLMSLKALLYFTKNEQVTYKIIEDFCKQYSNFLFACLVIGAVQFLKTYFHFGVLNSFSKFYIDKLCSRKTEKIFLVAMKSLETDEEREIWFYKLVCLYVKKMFRIWCEQNATQKLTVIDFGKIEKDYQVAWRKKAKKVFAKVKNQISAKRILTLFEKEEI